MRFIYSLFFYLAIPFILLRLLWRARQNRAYRKRWAERFGFFTIPVEYQGGLWLHAVSLGEVIAATPLVKLIQQHHPEIPIILTTMTVTGSNRVRETFNSSVFHVYVPYDTPTAVARFLNRVKPRGLVILETELWPNILGICQRRKIPVMLSNARLSERSAQRYQKIAYTTKKMLSAITILAAHAHADAQRFISLGISTDRVVVTGSIKFDTQVPPSIFEQAQVLRSLLGRERPVWVAASTHEGEEAQILAAFKVILNTLPNALLILVPRHPERFAKVIEYCRAQGYHTVTRTQQHSISEMTQVFVGDTMGELKLFYATSDVAFVGGSLVPIGGHNILEPASLGIPTITGPHTFNFDEITRLMIEAQALIQVHDNRELAQQVIMLLENSILRAEIRVSAEKVLENNKGALEKNLRLLETKILNQ